MGLKVLEKNLRKAFNIFYNRKGEAVTGQDLKKILLNATLNKQNHLAARYFFMKR